MDTSKHRNRDWSKLNPHVLRKIFETLIPSDSHNAKTVCSRWYSVLKTCANRPPSPPWRITHQGESSKSFDPDEDKIYTRKLSGLSGVYRMASSGNWLLMLDSRPGNWLLMHGSHPEFYLFNMLTLKKINLPSMEKVISDDKHWRYFGRPSRKDLGKPKDILGWKKVSKDYLEWKTSAALWIDDTTGDYVVAWIFRQQYLFSHKKGDDSWSNLTLQGTHPVGLLDVACKESKLHVFTTDNHIKIFDLSGDFPKEEEGIKNPYWNHPFDFVEQPWEYIWRRRIAIRNSGEVLIILSLKEKQKFEYEYEERLLFYVFKMNLESGKWERVYYIGDDHDEMLVFGHGVTVRAPVEDCFGDGIKSDSICFVDDDVWSDLQDHDRRASNCGVFDIATSRIEWRKRLCVYINETQWLAPGVAY
ncbi:unnamed protein product [Microthlaspi erraticum]|uniref:F-box domain-containing protein n=1 Tax=Microthlaspi erraticum TaxID=1685480 RepID=A0A6D2KR72_9BRAS|nr:unnamed protein product [Microthlaspi erraticum]